MKGIDLKCMSINELWALHEEIASVLSTKINAEKLKLEKRLGELGRKFEETSGRQRRPYPKVHPKFRNPEPPHETWSGRGRQPRWMTKLLQAGRTVEDLRISIATVKTNQVRRRKPAKED
jgi:DNA-binding protein H-NS